MKTVRIGRDPANDIVVTQPGVSARHAELCWDGKAVWLRDLDSTNGTYVNGRRIGGATRITASDRVTLGNTTALDVAAALAAAKGEGKRRTIRIGRATDNDMIINNSRVSAHHAVLEYKGAWMLCDLDSTNGTYVDGVKISAATRLRRGALVRFGATGPTYPFPDTFGVEYDDASAMLSGATGAGDKTRAPDTHAASGHTAIMPIASSRIELFRRPQVWAGLIVVIAMCMMFTYTGKWFAYNAYIYLFGLLSCAAVLWFIYRLCGKRHPWWYIVVPAAFTAFATVPALIVITGFIGTAADIDKVGFVQRLLEQTFITGLSEEFVKILPVLVLLLLTRLNVGLYHGLRIIEPLDSILVASSSAIMFVVLETIFGYCNPEQVHTDAQAWKLLQLLIPRIFASVGGHVAWSGCFGYFIGLGVLQPRRFWLFFFIGYGSAAFCHGLWNAVAPLGLILVGGFSFLLYMAAIARARAISRSQLRQTVYGRIR